MNNNETIEQVRHFTRFYAHFFGLYNNNYLESRFSLTEARVLFELGRDNLQTAKELSDNLQIDPGYLSRIIKRFEKEDYLSREISDKDARKHFLQLTDLGMKVRGKLDKATNIKIENILDGLSDKNRKLLCDKMRDIEMILKNKIDEN